jgi:two-component system, LuxR family, response regulator FixJ
VLAMKTEDSGFKVIVVDDDDAVRESLSFVLSMIYEKVLDFSSSVDFLDAAPDVGPGCLILDIHMPYVSGIDVMRELGKMPVNFPTILVTGRADSILRSKGESHGALAVLDKPLDHDLLIAAIERGRAQLNFV